MLAMEEHVAQVDGVRIRYFAAGSGPPVLFLHGVADSALDWRWIMPRLADRYRLIAPDLPGYSIGAGDGILHTPANYGRLLAMFVHEQGLARLAVVGNSLGGLVAIRLVLDNPGLVPALALVGCAGLGKAINPLIIAAITPTGDIAMTAATTWGGARLRSWLRSFILFANPWRVPPEWFEEQHRLIRIPSYRTAVLAVLRQTLDLAGQREIVADELPNIAIPTLVLWGGHDRMVPSVHGRNAVELLPDGRLEIFPDCGHVPQIDNPARFAEVLGSFLEERL